MGRTPEEESELYAVCVHFAPRHGIIDVGAYNDALRAVEAGDQKAQTRHAAVIQGEKFESFRLAVLNYLATKS